jgi:hypothetical protein
MHFYSKDYALFTENKPMLFLDFQLFCVTTFILALFIYYLCYSQIIPLHHCANRFITIAIFGETFASTRRKYIIHSYLFFKNMYKQQRKVFFKLHYIYMISISRGSCNLERIFKISFV